MTPTKKLFSLAAVGIAGLGFAACGDDDDSGPDTTTAVAASTPATDAATTPGTDAAAATDAATGTDDAEPASAGAGTVPSIPAEAQDEASAMLVDTLEAQGITLTDEQADCLISNSSGLNSTDQDDMLGLLEECDIDPADLAASAGG